MRHRAVEAVALTFSSVLNNLDRRTALQIVRIVCSTSTHDGFVTLPCREREVSAPQELSGRCDCGPPRGHRDSAKRALRVGGDEVALDVEGVVDGGMCGKKLLG